MTQLRALEQEKGIGHRQRSKVAMITSKDAPQDKLGAFGHECDAYLIKPFTKEDIADMVKGCLNKSAS